MRYVRQDADLEYKNVLVLSLFPCFLQSMITFVGIIYLPFVYLFLFKETVATPFGFIRIIKHKRLG